MRDEPVRYSQYVRTLRTVVKAPRDLPAFRPSKSLLSSSRSCLRPFHASWSSCAIASDPVREDCKSWEMVRDSFRWARETSYKVMIPSDEHEVSWPFIAHLELDCHIESVAQCRIQPLELVNNGIQLLTMKKCLGKPGSSRPKTMTHLSSRVHSILYHTPLHIRLVLH